MESGETERTRLLDVRPHERAALAVAFVYNFVTLASFYVLRPIREAIGVENEQILERLYTGTFVVMLVAVAFYGFLVSRLSRRRFVPIVYHVVAIITLLFIVFLRVSEGRMLDYVEYALYVWVSVYNLFVVSVFWSVMVDRFDRAQGVRLFGVIAVGGTLGAIAGSIFTERFSANVPTSLLPVMSIVLVELAALCACRLERVPTGRTGDPPQARAIGGGFLDGLRVVSSRPYLLVVAFYVLLLAMGNTLLYFAQADIVAGVVETREAQIAFFARLNLAVNIATVVMQFGVTAFLMQRLGVGFTLAILPTVVLGGFIALAVAPRMAVLFAVQVCARTSRYAFARPAREVLFTIVERASKYKAKSFIDTAVYRGGDVFFGWVIRLLSSQAGMAIPTILLVAIAPACAWIAIAIGLGRRVRK